MFTLSRVINPIFKIGLLINCIYVSIQSLCDLRATLLVSCVHAIFFNQSTACSHILGYHSADFIKGPGPHFQHCIKNGEIKASKFVSETWHNLLPIGIASPSCFLN